MGLQNNTDMPDGSNLLDLLNCLRDYLYQHGASGKPFDVLRGLTNLTIERADKGDDLKISSTALQVEVEGGITDKSPGSALAGPWKTLTERTLLEREQGLQKFFSQHGFGHYLWPMKDKSLGGAGNPSMYYLESRVIPSEHDLNTTESTAELGRVRYIPEITPRPAWWLKRLLEGGYALQGWRRWMLIGFGTISTLVGGIVLLLTGLLLVYSKNLTFQAGLSLFLSAVTVGWLSYSLVSPLVKLLDWRIIKAPDILVSLGEDNVLLSFP